MKKINKVLLTICAIITLLNVCTVGSMASTEPAPLTSTPELTVRGEETMWYYAYNNGVLQKRLWSLTYAKWLTDWIDV